MAAKARRPMIRADHGSLHRPRGVRLLLVRHGEAQCDLRDVVAGQRDCTGLTPRGHRQAQDVADRLAEEYADRVTAVYSTPVARAEQTASPIASALGISVVRGLPAPEYGDAGGKTWRSVLDGFKPPLDLTPDVPMAVGAEPWSRWVRRVGENVDGLAEMHSRETVILVCHRESIMALEQHFQRGPVTLEHATIEVGYTSITEWERRPLGATSRQWARLRHNDIGHMAPNLVR